MKIRIVNKGTRNQLVCTRKDDSIEVSDIGPRLPFHDIAHFVVERTLQLSDGFYGNIYKGYSVAQLSDKEVIRTLPGQSTVAEVVTRALQSLGSGACTIGQFTEMIGQEFQQYGMAPLKLEQTEIEQMLQEYTALLDQWQQLKEGEGLELWLEIAE